MQIVRGRGAYDREGPGTARLCEVLGHVRHGLCGGRRESHTSIGADHRESSRGRAYFFSLLDCTDPDWVYLYANFEAWKAIIYVRGMFLRA